MASGSLEATAPSDDKSAEEEQVRQAREEERRLVQSAIAHDAVAFAALYDLHVVRVYRHIYYLVHDVKQTEDLTAQIFLKPGRRSLAIRNAERPSLPGSCVSPTT